MAFAYLFDSAVLSDLLDFRGRKARNGEYGWKPTTFRPPAIDWASLPHLTCSKPRAGCPFAGTEDRGSEDVVPKDAQGCPRMSKDVHAGSSAAKSTLDADADADADARAIN